MLRYLVDGIENLIEDCKEKEYVVFWYSTYLDCYQKELLTKKQLLEFMKSNELKKIIVFKIKDEVKINKIFEIEDK